MTTRRPYILIILSMSGFMKAVQSQYHPYLTLISLLLRPPPNHVKEGKYRNERNESKLNEWTNKKGLIFLPIFLSLPLDWKKRLLKAGIQFFNTIFKHPDTCNCTFIFLIKEGVPKLSPELYQLGIELICSLGSLLQDKRKWPPTGLSR